MHMDRNAKMDLQTLSNKIEKKIKIFNYDVEARFLPNQREIQKLANVSLDLIVRDFSVIKTIGALNKLPETQKSLDNLLSLLDENIKKNHYWSFWHYSGLCLLTCFAYLVLLKKRKHQTIDLSKDSTWADPDWQVGVITINYIAGRMYPSSLAILMQISEEDDVSIEDLCLYIVKQVSLVTE